MNAGAVDLVVVGDANEDLYARVDAHPQEGCCTFGTQVGQMIGGSGFNVAVAAARLGLKTALVTAVGEDRAGDAVIQSLEKEGVDAGHVRRVHQPTGSVWVMVEATGERTFVSMRIDCADWQLRAGDLPNGLLERAGAVFVSGVLAVEAKRVKAGAGLALDALRRAREQGVRTFFDPNVRADDWNLPKEAANVLAELAGESQYYLPGEQEHETVAVILGTGGPCGSAASVIKAGGRGCTVWENGRPFPVPARPAQVLDTTGAGDSFDAGFIVGILKGMNARSAAEYATAVASITVSRIGTISAFPSRREVDALGM